MFLGFLNRFLALVRLYQYIYGQLFVLVLFQGCFQAAFLQKPYIPCQSLLLSTTILNICYLNKSPIHHTELHHAPNLYHAPKLAMIQKHHSSYIQYKTKFPMMQTQHKHITIQNNRYLPIHYDYNYNLDSLFWGETGRPVASLGKLPQLSWPCPLPIHWVRPYHAAAATSWLAPYPSTG